jgi:hypothetical protein
VLGVEPEAVVVPTGCVWNAPDGSTYVRIDTPEGPARRAATLGAILPDRLQIRSGLERGEVILCR